MRWPEAIVQPMRRPSAGHFARLHVVDLEAVFGDALLEAIEIGVFEHLEAHHVDARRIGAAQDNRMMVELVGRLQIDAAVGSFAHLMQADALGIVVDRRGNIEHADLDEARP